MSQPTLLPNTGGKTWYEIVNMAREASGIMCLVLVVTETTRAFIPMEQVVLGLQEDGAFTEEMLPLLHNHGLDHFPTLRQYEDGFEVGTIYCPSPADMAEAKTKGALN